MDVQRVVTTAFTVMTVLPKERTYLTRKVSGFHGRKDMSKMGEYAIEMMNEDEESTQMEAEHHEMELHQQWLATHWWMRVDDDIDYIAGLDDGEGPRENG